MASGLNRYQSNAANRYLSKSWGKRLLDEPARSQCPKHAARLGIWLAVEELLEDVLEDGPGC